MVAWWWVLIAYIVGQLTAAVAFALGGENDQKSKYIR